eukprot:2274717-Pleurochrysis_carterae.AAC.1
MVAPRSFPRPSVTTSVRASCLTDTPPPPFPSSYKTLNVRPSHYHATTPLRMLSRLVAVVSTSYVYAAASVRAH